MAARFLQSFDAPSLRDFLAFRTEYAPSLLRLWKAYFMDNNKIPEPIVDAARVLGQWINSAAYFAAKESHGDAPVEARILRRDKAKLLAEFEARRADWRGRRRSGNRGQRRREPGCGKRGDTEQDTRRQQDSREHRRWRLAS